MNYYAVRCKNCDRWGSKSTNKPLVTATYTCKYCGHSRMIKYKKDLGLDNVKDGFSYSDEVADWILRQTTKESPFIGFQICTAKKN